VKYVYASGSTPNGAIPPGCGAFAAIVIGGGASAIPFALAAEGTPAAAVAVPRIATKFFRETVPLNLSTPSPWPARDSLERASNRFYDAISIPAAICPRPDLTALPKIDIVNAIDFHAESCLATARFKETTLQIPEASGRTPLSRARMLACSAAVPLSAALRPLAGLAQSDPSLRVGSALIEAAAQAHYAADMGIFKANKLDVEVVPNNNGAASAAAVAGGDLQIAVISLVGFVLAANRGLPFLIVAPGGISDAGYPGSGLVVAQNSKLESPKDVNGKTVGVSALRGLDQMLTSVLVDKRGGDATTLKFVEVKPASMLDALDAGRIDAAYMDNPEFSVAKSRARVLGLGEPEVAKSFVLTVWFAKRDWLANNPETAHRFQDAIYAAGAWSMANPDRAGALLQQDLKSNQSRASQRFALKKSTTLNSYQALLDVAAKYGFIAPTNAKDLLWNA
jgi:NitT/TauT family transport system substrate-binding protein